ncbi:MAG: molybdenum cofactor guanylyltransferase [Actinomycetota bacterium]|nr:molybdenum cofactor guanylyltransferase [Actinomycetota bacterium]
MRELVGVILAGGQGRRLGGAKATISLAGRPLLTHPLGAMHAALAGDQRTPGDGPRLAVVAKPGTSLPALGAVPLWTEPSEPSHPLVGLIRALEGAGGRAVLVCPVDLPFITPATLRRLAVTPSLRAPALLAAYDGIAEPLLGRWEPAALAGLRSALRDGTADSLPPMRAVAHRLGAHLIEVDADELENVNTPADLARAQARLITRT